MFKQTRYLLQKEILIEWRAKYAFNSVLLYVISTVFVCYIAFRLSPGFKESPGYPIVWNVLFWIIMLFAAVNAIAKSFMTENKGRMLYYYSITDARAIILSKIKLNNNTKINQINIIFLMFLFNKILVGRPEGIPFI